MVDVLIPDLKPENLLFKTPDAHSELCLVDFGIAKLLSSPGEILQSAAGSFGYAAPEVMMRRGHGKSADLWSVGIISYTLLCGYSPFRSETMEDLIAEIASGQITFHQRYWQDISEDAKTFIKKLLSTNPKERPTAKEALNDAWLKENEITDKNLVANIREGFNARKEFRNAIATIQLANRIQHLHMQTDESSEDLGEGAYSTGHPSNTSEHDQTRLSPESSLNRPRSGSRGMIFQEVVRAKVRQSKESQDHQSQNED